MPRTLPAAANPRHVGTIEFSPKIAVRPVPVIPPIPLVPYYGGPALREKSLIKIRLRQKIKDMLDNQDKRWNKRSYSIDSAYKRSGKPTATHANNQITKALASLSPREEMLLRMRFGIGSDVEGTLSQLSRRFSLPPQRLGRIQSNAFSKLRQGSRYFLPLN
jgi:sigma-70-like protein